MNSLRKDVCALLHPSYDYVARNSIGVYKGEGNDEKRDVDESETKFVPITLLSIIFIRQQIIKKEDTASQLIYIYIYIYTHIYIYIYRLIFVARKDAICMVCH